MLIWSSLRAHKIHLYLRKLITPFEEEKNENAATIKYMFDEKCIRNNIIIPDIYV